MSSAGKHLTMLESEPGIFSVYPGCLQSPFVGVDGDPIRSVTNGMYPHIETNFEQLGRRLSYFVFRLV